MNQKSGWASVPPAIAGIHFSEEPVVKTGSKASQKASGKVRSQKKPVPLKDIDSYTEERLDTGFPEFSGCWAEE